MAAQILENLFDSLIKVRLLKIFLRNPDQSFQVKEIAKKIKTESRLVKKQVQGLFEISFLKQRVVKKSANRSGKKKNGLTPGVYYSIDRNFEFYNELASLVLKSSPASKDKILKNLQKLGRIKLALISGVFLNVENTRTDLLIIGDVNKKKLATFLSNFEAEIGKEITYSVMNIKEFNYRHSMFDRFIFDILEGPHEKLINKLKI